MTKLFGQNLKDSEVAFFLEADSHLVIEWKNRRGLYRKKFGLKEIHPSPTRSKRPKAFQPESVANGLGICLLIFGGKLVIDEKSNFSANFPEVGSVFNYIIGVLALSWIGFGVARHLNRFRKLDDQFVFFSKRNAEIAFVVDVSGSDEAEVIKFVEKIRELVEAAGETSKVTSDREMDHFGDELSNISDLYKRGVLTSEEFDRAKKCLIEK